MKAITMARFGPPEVLELTDVPTPAPKDNEILVQVHAASVNYGDTMSRNLPESEFNMPGPLWLPVRLHFGFRKPRIPIQGSEFSGVVAAIGSEVQRFAEGDEVFGYVGQRMGAHAEFLCLREDASVAHKPSAMSHAEAASVSYGGLMASGLLEKVGLQEGQRVLVLGASGGIGAAAVQLARHAGAQVTGVCSAAKRAYVEGLGAEEVLDYRTQDFTKNGQTYDLIFDVLGKSSFAACRSSLAPEGTCLLASFKTGRLFQMLWTRVRGGRQLRCALASEGPDRLEALKAVIEAGGLRSVIDRAFPLTEAAAAHAYAESRERPGGAVVLRMVMV